MKIENNLVEVLKLALAVILNQFLSAGIYLLYKLCADDGMNLNVMVAYRFIFAAAFMLPLAFFLERYGKCITIYIIFNLSKLLE